MPTMGQDGATTSQPTRSDNGIFPSLPLLPLPVYHRSGRQQKLLCVYWHSALGSQRRKIHELKRRIMPGISIPSLAGVTTTHMYWCWSGRERGRERESKQVSGCRSLNSACFGIEGGPPPADWPSGHHGNRRGWKT